MKKSLLVFIGVVSILCGCTQKENVTPPAQPKEEVEYEISFSEQQYNLELESSCNIEFQISPADSAHLVSFCYSRSEDSKYRENRRKYYKCKIKCNG